MREECLGKLLIINQAHLRAVMCDHVEFFNTARPHQGIDQQIPVPKMTHKITGPVGCRTVLVASSMTTIATPHKGKSAIAQFFDTTL